MKKIVIIVLFSSIILAPAFTQSVELARVLSYGDPISHNSYIDNESIDSGIHDLCITKNNEILIRDGENRQWVYAAGFGDQATFKTISQASRYGGFSFISTGFNYTVVGYVRPDTGSQLAKISNGIITQYSLPSCVNKYINLYSSYVTDDTVFFETTDWELLSIEFYEDKGCKFRNQSETKNWLDSGRGDELGYEYKNGPTPTYMFGDTCILFPNQYPSEFGITHNVISIEEDHKLIEYLWHLNMDQFGRDAKGLLYFYNENYPNDSETFDFAVLDSWTKHVYFYSVPKSAVTSGYGQLAYTVAPDGNLYFTGDDETNKQYYIKRVCNIWWDEMGINDRIIGQMNTNHVPLLTKMKGKENDGYCFENDFVWVTEQSKDKKWSKIKKIDGREGWVETKYIDINTMVPVTNASLGITLDQSSSSTSKSAAATPAAKTASAKILKAADNLRLRKTELTSSEVVTTMLKGTAVKVIATGRQDTIDGITANWVQVEIQSGGKDRNGNAIPAGTTGWCFGGYLE